MATKNNVRPAGPNARRESEARTADMFAPQAVHLIIAEYLDAREHVALSIDWLLPTTFTKQVFTHPMLEVEHAADFIATARPGYMTQCYDNNVVVSASILYDAGMITIDYVDGKIHDYITIAHTDYDTYHEIQYGKYVDGQAVSSYKSIGLYVQDNVLHNRSSAAKVYETVDGHYDHEYYIHGVKKMYDEMLAIWTS